MAPRGPRYRKTGPFQEHGSPPSQSTREVAESCGERNGHFPDTRRRAAWDWLTARGAILEHQPNSVLGHRQGLPLVVAVSDDLGKRGHAHGESAAFLGFKDHCKGMRGIHRTAPAIDLCLIVGDSAVPSTKASRRTSRPFPDRPVQTPRAAARERDVEENKAIEDRGVAAVENGEEAARRV